MTNRGSVAANREQKNSERTARMYSFHFVESEGREIPLTSYIIIKKKKSGDISLSIHQSYLLKVCVISKAVENHTNLYSEQDSRTDFT